MKLKPFTTSNNNESQIWREAAKTIKPAPNAADVIGITRPNPSTLFRAASLTAPMRAPTPEAAIRNPHPKTCL
jgi:hypothetical protein